MKNVIIIGGGPAGLAASIYLARAGLDPLVFAGSPPGGQLMLTSEVENYPGIENILGPELIEKYRKHAEKFGVKIIDQNITKQDLSVSPFSLFTADPDSIGADKNYSTRSVLITTGAKALWLGLESETRLRGKGVSACATCDGFFFKDKVVGVVGGGDTAMEEALTLTKFAKKIYIIHRKDSFRASKIMQERVLKSPKIEVIWNTVVEEILGQNRVESIRLTTGPAPVLLPASATRRELKVDGIFIAIGHKPDTDIFKGQIELDNKGYILTTERVAMESFKGEDSEKIENLKSKIAKFNSEFGSQTSVPGVFAAGDCVDYKYRQAATAVGMAVAAALEVEKYLAD